MTILMYHSVSAAVDAYTMSPAAFRSQVEFIADTYRIVRLKDFRAPRSSPEREVVMTFDDAFGDFVESALPVLAELAIPCTLFVPTGCIGGWNTWDRHLSGIGRKRIMTVDEIRAACATGLVDLGSHTVDHPRMSRLPRHQMQSQAVMSKTFLEDTFGVPIGMFSYPYGQRDDFSPLTSDVPRRGGIRRRRDDMLGHAERPSGSPDTAENFAGRAGFPARDSQEDRRLSQLDRHQGIVGLRVAIAIRHVTPGRR